MALYLEDSVTTLADSFVSGNSLTATSTQSVVNGSFGCTGGGMHLYGGSTTISSTTLSSNELIGEGDTGSPQCSGAAIAAETHPSGDTLVSVTRSTLGPGNDITVTSNSLVRAAAFGGALGIIDRLVDGVVSVDFENSTLSGNTLEVTAPDHSIGIADRDALLIRGGFDRFTLARIALVKFTLEGNHHARLIKAGLRLVRLALVTRLKSIGVHQCCRGDRHSEFHLDAMKWKTHGIRL